MDEAALEPLRARLRTLERRVAIGSGVLVFSIIMLLAFGLWAPRAPSQPQSVRARSVEVTDAAGRLRISLDAFGGKPGLWFRDTAGRRRIGLTVDALDVPAIVLHDERGRQRVTMTLGLERAVEISLIGSTGRPRVSVGVTHRDEPGIWLFDDLARPRIGLKVFPDGQPRIWVFEHPTGRVLFSAP